jgi:hypothetical protein
MKIRFRKLYENLEWNQYTIPTGILIRRESRYETKAEQVDGYIQYYQKNRIQYRIDLWIVAIEWERFTKWLSMT